MTFIENIDNLDKRDEIVFNASREASAQEVYEEHENASDEEPDVDDIDLSNKDIDNGRVDSIAKVLEVLDEDTCLEMLKSYYSVLNDQDLPENCRCDLQGCEFDQQSETYRLQATLSVETTNVCTYYIIVKIESTEGLPKILGIS